MQTLKAAHMKPDSIGVSVLRRGNMYHRVVGLVYLCRWECIQSDVSRGGI